MCAATGMHEAIVVIGERIRGYASLWAREVRCLTHMPED